jgi:hypothetical protein
MVSCHGLYPATEQIFQRYPFQGSGCFLERLGDTGVKRNTLILIYLKPGYLSRIVRKPRSDEMPEPKPVRMMEIRRTWVDWDWPVLLDGNGINKWWVRREN